MLINMVIKRNVVNNFAPTDVGMLLLKIRLLAVTLCNKVRRQQYRETTEKPGYVRCLTTRHSITNRTDSIIRSHTITHLELGLDRDFLGDSGEFILGQLDSYPLAIENSCLHIFNNGI